MRIRADFLKIGREWNMGGKTAKKWGFKNPVITYAQRFPKEIKKQIRLHLRAAGASAVPPLGPTLGQFGIPIMRFCESYNALSSFLCKRFFFVIDVFQTYDNDFFF